MARKRVCAGSVIPAATAPAGRGLIAPALSEIPRQSAAWGGLPSGAVGGLIDCGTR